MICPKCHQPVENGTKFCTQCGTSLAGLSVPEPDIVNTPVKSDNSTSSILLIFLVVSVITNVTYFIITHTITYWWDNKILIVVVHLLYVINSASMLLIPFAVKNNVMKIIAFVITIPYVIFLIIRNIMSMVDIFSRLI